MKQQLVLTGSGILILASLFIFGNTVARKQTPDKAVPQKQESAEFNIQQYITEEKNHLSPSQSARVTALENSVGRGDVKDQQISADKMLAGFWKDSIKVFEPYAYYLSEASKLENSEKSLTFAARLLAGYLRNEPETGKRLWMADLAIELFEKALVINPSDEALKVEMGSCYVYGYAQAGKADKAMKGILMLKDIADKDSTNLQANLLVGIGGVISQQFDKAIVRLTKVVAANPGNLEAVSYLAEAYAGKGENKKAIGLLEMAKQIAKNPEFSKVVDDRIKELR